MVGQFSKSMAEHSDATLAEILTTRRHEYQEEAIKDAQAEFERRNLSINDFKIKAPAAAVETYEVGLNLVQKILTVLLPFLVAGTLDFLIGPGVGLFIQFGASVFIQLLLFQIIKEKRLFRMASEFKKWSVYGWVFLLVTGFVLFLLAAFSII